MRHELVKVVDWFLSYELLLNVEKQTSSGVAFCSGCSPPYQSKTHTHTMYLGVLSREEIDTGSPANLHYVFLVGADS